MRDPYSFRYFACLLTLLFVLPVSSNAQYGTSWEAAKYSGVPAIDRHSILNDEFVDNRNNWNLESKYLDMRIQGTDFYLRNLQNRAIVKRKRFAFDLQGDYEIEIRMRYVRGISSKAIGLTFGRDKMSNEYNFYFKPDGEYKISRYYQYRSQDIKVWTREASISKYSYNTLTVRKVRDQWYFFLNRKLVHNTRAYKLFGDDFGFTISGETAIEVDYLKIHELHPLDSRGPKITLSQPYFQGVYFSSNDEFLELRGHVEDESGISELSINGEPIQVLYGGNFYTRLNIINRSDYFPVDIVAKDQWNNISKKSFQVRYTGRPAPSQTYTYQQTQPTQHRPTYPTNTSQQNGAYGATPWQSNTGDIEEGEGETYLLLIAVNEYTYWGNLNNAVKDVHDLANVLTTYYQFSPENIVKLLNKEATRENILETFEKLQDQVKPNDKLLIYYAGHGFYDKDSELGYWVPVNARQRKIPDYIRNSTIHDYLKTIKSKHTLLVVDACYAGSLFASRGSILNENYKSRWAFTSGDIEKVWDGAPGQNSPFAAYLINYLKSNRKQRLSAEELLEAVKLRVSRNTQQTPRWSPLQGAGDEGGVFIFRRTR